MLKLLLIIRLPIFTKRIVTLFQSVLDTVKRASAYSAFWDENGKKTPKKESKITPIIHRQLLTLARIKGFEVTHQDTGAGILDFRVGASLSDGKKTFVCIRVQTRPQSTIGTWFNCATPRIYAPKGVRI